MSAYICEANTLYKVMNLIKRTGGYGRLYKKKRALVARLEKEPSLIYNQLAALNKYSIEERYGFNHGMGEVEPYSNHLFNNCLGMNYNKYELLKALLCYLYQSCEGKAGEQDLYLLLEAMQDEYALKIVLDSKQYSVAGWG